MQLSQKEVELCRLQVKLDAARRALDSLCTLKELSLVEEREALSKVINSVTRIKARLLRKIECFEGRNESPKERT